MHKSTINNNVSEEISSPSIQKLKYQIQLQQYDMPNSTYLCWLSVYVIIIWWHNEKSKVKNAYIVCCVHLLASLIDCRRDYVYSVCVCS